MLADFVVDNNGDNKRTDKSLGILTRKFVQILQKTSNGVLDLKYVSEFLDKWVAAYILFVKCHIHRNIWPSKWK